MNIFNRKTNKKHIEQFGNKIAELLEFELPQLKNAIRLKQVSGVYFVNKTKGIQVLYSYTPNNYELIRKYHRANFYLTGISVFNVKSRLYESLKLYYQSDSLTEIMAENPEYFHKTFDLSKIQKNAVELEYLKFENPDRKIAERILGSLTNEQLSILELDFTFEIEFNEKLFYTILDMEDGNYIAVDEKGKVYRLNHDEEERVKLIANKLIDFFEIYSGEKRELEKIMYK